ncbi:hypothetical protein A9Q96_09740 [Rhodobacterales bacterium 52_120_T64]|nr:hypothetical protein A9Q96_09740 [Rhodobacterales bacterium 52_120_T64]
MGFGTFVFAQNIASEESGSLIVEPILGQQFVTALHDYLEEGGSELLELKKFYAAQAYQPIWADGTTDSMLALLTAIEQAPKHGMSVSRYNTAELEALWVAANTPEDFALLEYIAAQSYVKFAKELNAGMLDPRGIPNPGADHDEMYATRYVPKTSDLLDAVADAADKSAYYKTLQPSSPEYAEMLKLKAELESLISSNGWGPVVPNGRTLRLGNSSGRVAALRLRLDQRGYEPTDLTSPEYDNALVEVVKLFQQDFGLNADGVIGPQTLTSINAQPDERLKQVIVNLERLRWMNYDLGDRHVYVNIPDFRASIIDDSKPTLSFRVVVGKNKYQTTEFSDVMTHMVINPSWNVPNSIATEEYLPQLRSDPTVLLRQNIQMMVRSSGQLIDSSRLDYAYFTEDNFPFFLKQTPGSGNALGRVKFMFPNRFNIYMHDTPARSLFTKDARAFSHGCVRVQKPLEFAHALLSLQTNDPKSLFESILSSGEETQINLAKPVPVHIVYRTAWINRDGEAQFRHDIYGRDKLVYDALVNAGFTTPAIGS